MVKRKYLLKEDGRDDRDYRVSKKRMRMVRGDVVLPVEYSLVGVMPGIYDQGSVGLCFANAGCRIFDSMFYRKCRKFINPSRLFLGVMTRKDEGTLNQDAGATLRGTIKAMVKYGIPPEEMYPYDTVRMFELPPMRMMQLAEHYQALKYYSVPNGDIEAIKVAIYSGYPVMFGARLYKSFESEVVGRTGMVPMPKSGEEYVGGHAMTCLHEDTKISLLDGNEISIKEAYDKFNNKNFDVYSCNNDGKIVRGNAHSIQKTGTNRKLLKIILDNNEFIKCTPEHKFLMRDGTYKEAQFLKEDDSLMPLYRKVCNKNNCGKNKKMEGYELLLQPYNQEWEYTHRVIALENINNYKGVVHHKNFNKRDNTINNLQLMTWDEHINLHIGESYYLNKWAASDIARKKSSETMHKLWSDPEWKKRRIEQNRKNGVNTCNKLKKEGKLGFQNMEKDKLNKLCTENGRKNCHTMHTKEAIEKSKNTRINKFINDPIFREKIRVNAKKASLVYSYNMKIKNKKFNGTFDDYVKYMNDKKLNETKIINHKVLKIEDGGYGDVYDLTVDNYHNFALSSGIFVHNCVGYDDNKRAFLVANSWGVKWGLGGYCWMPYDYFGGGPVKGFWSKLMKMFTFRSAINYYVFDMWVVSDTEIGE